MIRRRIHALAPIVVCAALPFFSLALPSTRAGFVATTANAANAFASAASFTRTFYLHDDPTPPTAHGASSALLGLDETAPTASTLFNYDTDRDAFAGLLLAVGTGLGETDLTKMQRWATPTLAQPLSLVGPVSFRIWTTMKDFQTGKAGGIEVGAYDCNATATSCTLIASSASAQSPWPSTWTQRTVSLGTWNTSIAASRRLVVKLTTTSSSEDALWFAYDTTAYPARLTVG